MNLTEIKNATREELIDYLQMCGNDSHPNALGLHGQPVHLTSLRNAAREMYWKNAENNGYGFESVVGGAY